MTDPQNLYPKDFEWLKKVSVKYFAYVLQLRKDKYRIYPNDSVSNLLAAINGKLVVEPRLATNVDIPIETITDVPDGIELLDNSGKIITYRK